MCGIFGLYSKSGVDIQKCQAAFKLLTHRGPDKQSTNSHLDDRLFLGHTRLKIIDIDDRSNQPMSSACNNYEIIYNGEIYNYLPLREKISNEFEFKTQSDTEVLLNLFIKYGASMLEMLNGMFAFTIYDKRKNLLFMGRDRFGIKPFYYSIQNGEFCFASEIKPILHIHRNANANEQVIKTYLTTSQYNFSEQTFFADVLQIPAGHFMIYHLSDQTTNIQKWYNLGDLKSTSNVQTNDIYAAVEQTLADSVQRHLIADVNVGLNVSGGVDSSILIHFATKFAGKLDTFTQDFDGYSELPWVKEATKDRPVRTHFANLTATDIQAEMEHTLIHQEQPYGGVTVVGDSSLYEMARENNITVLLDGNGIDEIFLGYKKYHLEHLYMMRHSSQFTNVLKEYCAFWNETESQAIVSIDALSMNNCMIDGITHSQKQCLSKELAELDQIEIPTVDLFDDQVKNSAARDLLYTKTPRGLRFNDRVSMMHSCELRVPFLDHELVELAYSLPIENLINQKGTKAIVREVLAKYVDKKIAFAPKRSIQSPQNDWLADEWRDFVEDIINSRSFKERGWFDVDKVKASYKDYRNGNKKTSFYVWQWLNLETWARAFLD